MGAEAIAEEARNRVPVNTGRLRDAIHVEKRASGVEVGGQHVGGVYSDWFVVAGDTKAFYGHMVEFGTTHSPAHPFLIPAFESRRPVLEGLVREALQRLGKRGEGVKLTTVKGTRS